MKNTCVIGYGTVGKATAEAFGIKKFYSRSQSNMTLDDVANTKFIFICLPTPTENGKQKNEHIVEFIQDIKKRSKKENIFIIRSTVIPGFNGFLQEHGIDNAVSNPEFLSEDTAVKDAKNPELIVIGGENRYYVDQVHALYMGRFKSTDYIITDSVTAELIKYSLNVFFSLKVIFANELYDFVQQMDGNYQTIKRVLEKHKWGSKNHFSVWYKDKRGIHGKCLPKDLEAFAHLSDSPLFYTLLERNKKFL